MEEIRLCTKRERGQSSNKHTASRAAHEIQNGAKICINIQKVKEIVANLFSRQFEYDRARIMIFWKGVGQFKCERSGKELECEHNHTRHGTTNTNMNK